MNKLSKNGYDYFDNKIVIKEIKILRKFITKNFNQSEKYYNSLTTERFRSKVFNVKKKIVKSNVVNIIRKKVSDFLKIKLNIDDEIYFTSFFAFLVARPKKRNYDEVLDFHREAFYAGKDKKFIKHQLNIWVPLFDLKQNQAMRYIPKSHKISDTKFNFKSTRVDAVKKNSPSHHLGYLHTTKRIIKGVNLKNAKRFKTPKNKCLFFDSNLIHGSGTNLSNKMRFVIAFGIIEKKKYLKYKKKTIKTFRSNQEYFISNKMLNLAS